MPRKSKGPSGKASGKVSPRLIRYEDNSTITESQNRLSQKTGMVKKGGTVGKSKNAPVGYPKGTPGEQRPKRLPYKRTGRV